MKKRYSVLIMICFSVALLFAGGLQPSNTSAGIMEPETTGEDIVVWDLDSSNSGTMAQREAAFLKEKFESDFLEGGSLLNVSSVNVTVDLTSDQQNISAVHVRYHAADSDPEKIEAYEDCLEEMIRNYTNDNLIVDIVKTDK